tara:strand:+ start:1475 stop:1861 length:387 start_codon:yes stop_codon:yes gene_type:complete
MEEDIKKDYQENVDTLVTFGKEGYTMRKDDPRTEEAKVKSKGIKEGKLKDAIQSGELSLWAGINLSNKREDNEDFLEYKDRLKTIKGLEKIYKQLGREECKRQYPMGFSYAIRMAMENQLNKELKNKK